MPNLKPWDRIPVFPVGTALAFVPGNLLEISAMPEMIPNLSDRTSDRIREQFLSFMKFLAFLVLVTLGLQMGAHAAAPAAPLKVAYSDWPGWVAWDIAVQKGWFKEAGVDVEFVWFEYVPSMDAYAAGKVDGVCMTNGDALVTGANGKPSKGILLNDFSNGNDMVVAKAGIKTVKDLKGKKIGVEVGFVDHLLLLKGLEAAGLQEKDVTLVNMPTGQTAQGLASGSVDAIAAWQPNSGQALKEVPGSTAIFTSANAPGLIYDLLYVSPESLSKRKADWKKVVQVWFRVVDFIKDDKNKAEYLKIMSARVGLKPEAYEPLMKGTQFLDAAGNKKHFAKGKELASVYGSSQIVDDFNMKNAVYKKAQAVDAYLDGSLIADGK
jgi:NitT/TauT family transport system substrate-binding protein